MITIRYLFLNFFYAQKLVKLQQSRLTWVVTHAELTEKKQILNFSQFCHFFANKTAGDFIGDASWVDEKTKF